MADPRIFTLAEADRTLPLVSRVVRDIIAEYPKWREALARYELLTGGARAEWGESPELVGAREEITRRAERINHYLGELEGVGCVFKGFDAGLVDFYALREDRLVFLCWRLGEPRITHWHELDAGFAGRQPVDPALMGSVVP
jgi:hypothetical protein